MANMNILHFYSIPICSGLGLEKPIGHVDFYPNGGEDQPGCGRFKPTCDHSRSHALYIDSIINAVTCPMIGHKCLSYKEFEGGICSKCGGKGNICINMGYRASKDK